MFVIIFLYKVELKWAQKSNKPLNKQKLNVIAIFKNDKTEAGGEA